MPDLELDHLAVVPIDEVPRDALRKAALLAADDLDAESQTADVLHDHGWFVAEYRCRAAAALIRALCKRLAAEPDADRLEPVTFGWSEARCEAREAAREFSAGVEGGD